MLLVDGGSDDGTLQVVEGHDSRGLVIRIMDNPERITPVAMNLGVSQAQSNVIIILGAHAEVTEDFVKRNLDAIKSHPESQCFGGVVEHIDGDESSR